jgi:anti-sigma-K factor RskA
MPFEENHHVLDLLPAFVLDALADDETIQVVSHLEHCPSCQAELASLQHVADDLPLALAQASPPPALKSRLLSSIHSRQSARLQSATPVTPQKRLSAFQKYLPVFGLAFLLVIAVVNVVLWRQLYASSRQAGSQFQVVALANTQNSPSAVGELVMDRSGQYGTLVVDKLADLGSASQYQVWLIRNGERTSGGVFSVNPDGYAALEIHAPQPLDSYDSIGVSIEPYGGSPAPTGDRVLAGTIPR